HDCGHAEAARGADRDQSAASGTLLFEHLGQARDDAPAGGAERMARGERAAVRVQLVAVDAPEWCVEAELLLAVDRVLPGLERAQDLGRERLVNLVEVEVLQGEVVALEEG